MSGEKPSDPSLGKDGSDFYSHKKDVRGFDNPEKE